MLKKTLFLALLLALSAAQLLAQAQASTGQIVGTIVDPSGAVIPGVKVTITSLDTGAVRELATNEAGQYRAVLLPAGRYKVTAQASGFSPSTANDVVVNVGTAVDVNFTLKVGAVAETVEVSAPLVEVTRSESGSIIDAKGILNLPINGRRFQDLVNLAPTAQTEQRRGQPSLLGQRGINTTMSLDGQDYTNSFFGGVRGGERSNFAPSIPQGAIAEFQVVPQGYAPEFGRSTGGVVTAITKNGSNSLHGAAFYLLRQKELGLKNALEQQSLENRHQFGGDIGGPIRRDRMFFFGAVEKQYSRIPRQVFFRLLRSTPRTAQNGEAWDFYKSLEEPFTQTDDPLLFTGRFDYQFKGGHRFFARYNGSRNTELNATSVGGQVDPLTNQAQSSNGTEIDRINTASGQFISIVRPTVANEARFQFSREERPRPANAIAPTVSNAVGAFGTRSFLGVNTETDDRYQVSDTLNWQHGTHSLKLGVDYNRVNVFQAFGFNQEGAFSFGTSDANTLLTLLSRSPNRFDPITPLSAATVTYRKQIGNLQLDFTQNEVAFYAQDSWRMRPSFTLNYGLRWEGQYLPDPVTSNTDVLNRVVGFQFPQGQVDPRKKPELGNQWMPRLGFAWAPARSGGTVIRANVGIFYAHTPMLTAAGPMNNFRLPPGDVAIQLPITVPASNPNKTLYQQLKLIGVDLNNFTLDKLPILTAEQVGSVSAALGVASPNPFNGLAPITWALGYKNPRALQFGAGFEREVGRGISAYANFNYVNTVHLNRNRDINLPVPIIRATDKALRPFFGLRSGTPRPNSFFNSITLRQSSARALYRSGSIGVRARRSRYQFDAHYTFAWNYDDDYNERDATELRYENSYNLKPEYSFSTLDVRHTFVASGLVTLKWGIEVSTTWRLRSALPFSPGTGADTNEDFNSLQGADRPYSASGVPFQRNSFRNLAFYNSDLRVLKGFRLWSESSKLQISAEMFNLFNFDNIDIGGINDVARNYGLGIDPRTGDTLPPLATFRRIIDPANGKIDRNNGVGTPFQFQLGVRLIF